GDLQPPSSSPLPSGGEGPGVRGQPRAPATAAVTLADAEREHILAALREAGWVVGGPNGAAARLGMKRTTLQKEMQKLGHSRPEECRRGGSRAPPAARCRWHFRSVPRVVSARPIRKSRRPSSLRGKVPERSSPARPLL